MRNITKEDLLVDPDGTYRNLRKLMRACLRPKVHAYHLDDLLQDCWMKLAEAVKVRDYENLSGLAVVIVRRAVADHYRHNHNNFPHECKDNRYVEDREDASWLREVVANMPQIHRDVIEPFYFRQMTWKEIGQELGISWRAVAYRLAKAKACLKEMIENA